MRLTSSNCKSAYKGIVSTLLLIRKSTEVTLEKPTYVKTNQIQQFEFTL